MPPLSPLDVLCGSSHLTPCMLRTHSCPPHPPIAPLPCRQHCPVLLQPLWYLTVRVLHTSPAACPAAASSPRNVGEASFLYEAFRACLVPPPFALVSPQLSSFLSSLPCSSFLLFDVCPLLCSRVRAAYQVEMAAPAPQLGAIISLCFPPEPLLWSGSEQTPAVG